MLIQFADFPVGKQRTIHDLLQILPVSQIKISTAGCDQFALTADLYHKERKPHLVIMDFSGYALLHGAGGNGAHHADALHLHILPGKVDHHTQDTAQQQHNDHHYNADEFDPEFPDHASFTSR